MGTVTGTVARRRFTGGSPRKIRSENSVRTPSSRISQCSRRPISFADPSTPPFQGCRGRSRRCSYGSRMSVACAHRASMSTPSGADPRRGSDASASHSTEPVTSLGKRSRTASTSSPDSGAQSRSRVDRFAVETPCDARLDVGSVGCDAFADVSVRIPRLECRSSRESASHDATRGAL